MTLVGYDQLRARFAAISGPMATSELMTQLGTAAVGEQKLLEAPHRKTGITGASIHVGAVSASSVETIVGGAGRYLELGTPPHEITPKARKALAWAQGEAGGAFRRLSGATRVGVGRANIVFARRVHHPGTAPAPFMVPGAEAAVQKAGLLDRIVERWNRAA